MKLPGAQPVTEGFGGPLENLILMRFLGISAHDFFLQLNAPLWFEDGPWPCLNPICANHFGQR